MGYFSNIFSVSNAQSVDLSMDVAMETLGDR